MPGPPQFRDQPVENIRNVSKAALAPIVEAIEPAHRPSDIVLRRRVLS